MHSEFVWLDVVFRVCLFSVLAYKLYSLVRQYVVPMLVEYIHDQRKKQAEFVDKDKLLFSTRKRLENQLAGQKQSFLLLEKNMQRWIAHQKEACQSLEGENKNLIERLNQRRASQKKNMKFALMVQENLADAYSQAHVILVDKYAGEHGREAFERLVKNVATSAGLQKKSGQS